MSEAATLNEKPIVTERAARRINAILKKEAAGAMLRVAVNGGGCSGFQYGFTFDATIQEDDTIIEQKCSQGDQLIKLLIDPLSYPYLQNAEIDYVQNIQGEQFVIRNPNAKTTCGCGSSFSIDEDEDEEL
jgi:iron-sulfur cluster insertion protein